jgi:hypothetical protein
MRTLRALPILLLAACIVDDEPILDEGEVDQSLSNASQIGEPTWSVWLGNCTASVLDERWLLTSGPCITPGTGIAVVTIAVGSAGTQTVYSGLSRNYVRPGSMGYDVGLVYLDDRGLDLAGIGKAKLYSDSRRPWRSSSEPSEVTWAGWGNGGSDCSTAHRLRVAEHDLVQDSIGDYYATMLLSDTPVRACPGDRGGQFLVTRGGERLQIAVYEQVYAFYNRSRTVGALYSLNREWIESTIAAETSRAFVTSWTTGWAGGYEYRQSNLASDGFEPLTGYEYRCMDIGKDGVVVMRACTGVGSQKWAFPTSGEIVAYNALPLRDRECLAIDSTAVGAQLHVKPCDGSDFQRFAYTQDGRLRSAMASTRCLKAQGAGQPVVVAACQTGAAQQMWSTSPIPPP